MSKQLRTISEDWAYETFNLVNRYCSTCGRERLEVELMIGKFYRLIPITGFWFKLPDWHEPHKFKLFHKCK